MNRYKALSIIGATATGLFIVAFIPGTPIYLPAIEDTALGKIVIGYVVLGGVVPWLYLLETTKEHRTKKEFFKYFFGCWLLAPYFLYNLGGLEHGHKK